MKQLIDSMLGRISDSVEQLKEGLDPDVLSYWYRIIVSDAREMAPSWLSEKINVTQDPILKMKFNLDISKRAVMYFMMAVEQNLDYMPYSTRLYFLKVEEIMTAEMDKSLV